MADYTVQAGRVGVQSKTLAINTVDTVTFDVDLEAVVVFSDGAAPLYFSVDGSTPTIGGDNTYVLPRGVRAVRRVIVPTSGDTVIKLISSGAPTYSVEEGTDEEQSTLGGYLDGLEGLVTAVRDFVDGLETLQTSGNTKLDQLHTDIATTLAGYVDGLETLSTAIRDYLDTVETKLQTLITGPLLVDSRPAEITVSTSDGQGNLLTWTERYPNGTTLAWTATYHADGSVATLTHA